MLNFAFLQNGIHQNDIDQYDTHQNDINQYDIK
jgi:hypothetical protein